MAKTAEKYKHVKNGMVEGYFLDAVNNGTGGIGESSGNQPEYAIN